MGEGDISANIAKIAPEHRALEAPSFLRELQGWCVWRYEDNPGKPKPRKVPYWSGGGRRYLKHGSPEDREKLTSFAAARDAAARRGMDGVGFALLPEWHITALDFDNIVDCDGNIPDDIMAIVGQTYAEYSPSGNGVRAFFKGDLGSHSARPSGDDCEFSTYNTSGFVTLTAQPLPITEIMGYENHMAPVDENLRAYCERRFGGSAARERDPDDFMVGREPRVGMTPEEIEETINRLDPGCTRDEWIRVGMAVHHECDGDDTGLDLWDEWSCTADNYVSRHDLEAQWHGFTRRQGSGPSVTMRSVLKMVKDLPPSAADVQTALAEGAKLADDTHIIRTPDGYDGKFRVHTPSDLSNRPAPEWFIKGVLPKAPIMAIFGPSGSGKSFTGIQLLGSISRGADWRGHRTRQARVMIVAAEGSGSFNLRLEAYARSQMLDLADINMGIITDAPNLLEKDDVTEIIKAITAAGGADIIEFDTFAQTTPGANENSGEDMGRALANAMTIHRATGATIILVLHTGKDLSKGSRGWSGIKAAMDAQIEVVRHEEGKRELHLEKMRDGQDGLRFGFALETMTLRHDADGDPVTSCHVIDTDRSAK